MVLVSHKAKLSHVILGIFVNSIIHGNKMGMISVTLLTMANLDSSSNVHDQASLDSGIYKMSDFVQIQTKM